MLCEVIAYILSRQRLSAKTFVTGCVFFMFCRIDCLCGCCATPPVSESCRHHYPTGSPFGHHPRLRIVCPLRGQWVRAGRFPFFLSLHFSTSPRVRPSGITRGYAWCVPSGDSGCGLGGFPFFSLSTSPRGHPSGITRGYAWCVPSGDSGCGSHHKKSV